MFKLTKETLENLKKAIVTDFQPALIGPQVHFGCLAGCTAVCKASCSSSCKGSCKGGCTRSCKGNSR